MKNIQPRGNFLTAIFFRSFWSCEKLKQVCCCYFGCYSASTDQENEQLVPEKFCFAIVIVRPRQHRRPRWFCAQKACCAPNTDRIKTTKWPQCCENYFFEFVVSTRFIFCLINQNLNESILFRQGTASTLHTGTTEVVYPTVLYRSVFLQILIITILIF